MFRIPGTTEYKYLTKTRVYCSSTGLKEYMRNLKRYLDVLLLVPMIITLASGSFAYDTNNTDTITSDTTAISSRVNTNTSSMMSQTEKADSSASEIIVAPVNLSGKFGISFGYPYVGLKFGLSPDLTTELRGAYNFSDEIYVVSGRLYSNVFREQGLIGYLGLEGGWTKFNTERTAGTGYYAMLFGGGEYFFAKDVSFGFDIGPAYIVLGTNYGGIDFSNGGIELVYNVNLTLYF